jgi:NifU-like protein involved in Fe-S cluster formation
MVKNHLHTLALRALQTNREVSSHLTRIQHGFLPGKSIHEAQKVIQDMQKMLCEMQEALKAPTPTSNCMPLK